VHVITGRRLAQGTLQINPAFMRCFRASAPQMRASCASFVPLPDAGALSALALFLL
jgi:hypothetical protein